LVAALSAARGTAPLLDIAGFTDRARRLAPATIHAHVRRGPAVTPEARLLTEQATELTRRYPHLAVVLHQVPADRYAEGVGSQASAGTLGDVVWMGGADDSLLGAAARRVVAPLDGLAARDRLFLDQYYAQAVEGVTCDGRLYGLPFASQPGAALLAYDQTLFAETGAGIPDTTWNLAKLELAAGRVARRETIGYLPPTDYAGVVACVRAFGGAALSPDGRRCLLESPESTAALSWLRDAALRAPASAGGPSHGETMRRLFVAGRLASARVDTAFAAARQGSGARRALFVIPHPRGPGGACGGACETDAFSVVTTSGQRDAAWEWAKWITRQEAGIRLAELGGAPGGRPDVYRSERLLNDGAHRAALDVMEAARARRHVHNARTPEFEVAVEEGLRPLWEGAALTIPEFVRRLVGTLQPILDLPPPRVGAVEALVEARGL
jgi:ABC-type glycerol-3-phosphate transport system substrate-binding protein